MSIPIDGIAKDRFTSIFTDCCSALLEKFKKMRGKLLADFCHLKKVSGRILSIKFATFTLPKYSPSM